ncbi:MAG: DeoR/GlpR family DNA-binding transcription regulator [Gemmatimonadota bacterium]|nr:DeoR/GlpR family DNA-binding transcription regulator [Gemmatimonadota bacterium]
MKPLERRNEILALLRAMQRELTVEELAHRLGVSTLTVRRDLQQLAGDKTIIRTHGGCLAAGRASLETEYYRKVALNYELKQAVGRRAAQEVGPGENILINDGSTTYHLASHLGALRGPLTVYTNSLAMISELSRFDNIRLFILGGGYDPELYSLSGSLTENMLQRLHFDKVFLGVDAVDEDSRCLVNTQSEAGLTRAMLASGGKKILLADHTKAGAKGYVAYGTLNDFDMWITTPGISPERLAGFKEKTIIMEA